VHIERVHRQPVFCFICKEVFRDGDAYARLDEHLRQEPPCQFTADPDPPGDISAKEYDELFLANKGKRGAQIAADGVDIIHKGWYYLWDKIFPNTPRPNSIFWDTSPATDLAASHVEQYMASNIPQQHLLTQIFQHFGVVIPDVQTTQSILDVLFGGYLVFIQHGEQAQFVHPTLPGLVLGEVDDNFGEGPVQQLGNIFEDQGY
jgi:hypothetical protein